MRETMESLLDIVEGLRIGQPNGLLACKTMISKKADNKRWMDYGIECEFSNRLGFDGVFLFVKSFISSCLPCERC